MNTEVFDLGKIGITLGGEYDNKVVYEKLTIVLYKGKSYISTKITQGVSPEQNILIWQLVAEAKDAYHMLVDSGKTTLTEEEFLEQLVDATKGRYIVQGNVINTADEEDLTVEHSSLLGIDTLKLANRDNTNGMGYIILRKNKTFAEQVTKENTIYEIRYNFTLTEDVTIPANCTLKFEGGSINGAYTLTGNNTGIQAGLVKIFNTDITLAGTWNIDASYLEWFGSTNSIEDATEFLTKAYSLCNKVCLVKSYNLPNGFTLNGGALYSTSGYASVKLGAPINIRASYTKIHNLSFSSSDKDNIEAFVFGENSNSSDCYNVEIVSCIIQTFKTAFVINNWTANLFIEKCVINNTISIIEAKKLNYANTRFNVCIKDSITIYTDYFAKSLNNINLNCTDCYFGVTANTYYFTGSWSNIVNFTRCTFELAREGSVPTPAPLFYIQGVNRFTNCSFSSNTATKCYWFGHGTPDVFELNSCKFSDFGPDHKITGLFHYLALPKKYGTIKIRNLQYGLNVIRRPQDYLTEFVISQEYYGYFDFVDYSGICIYCGDGNYDVSKMNDGIPYNIYENNKNGDYLYTIIKNNNNIIKTYERKYAELPNTTCRIDSQNNFSREIGFNLFNVYSKRPTTYLEYTSSLETIEVRNQAKYINNTCEQGKKYRVSMSPNLISGYDAPLYSVKLCKSNTQDSDDDIILNFKAIYNCNEVFADFIAPDNSVYPYIKITNTSNVYVMGSIIKVEKGFMEYDGELYDINRSGTFANAPTPRNVGFAYFATDKGTAGVGAMIYYTGNSETPWVYADGTAVN